MRIISGEFRRRVLAGPPDDTVTRPIPDRVKESLFQILRGHFEGATVFDGFAGTGAIGLEAVSRGAVRCVMVERDRDIAALLTRNVQTLGLKAGPGERCEVITGDALGPGALARAPRPLTLAFLDPPYPLVEEPLGLRRVLAQLQALVGLLSPQGYAVLRTPWPLVQTESPGPTASEGTLERRNKPVRKGKARNADRAAWKRQRRTWEEGGSRAPSGPKDGRRSTSRRTPAHTPAGVGEEPDGDGEWVEMELTPEQIARLEAGESEATVLGEGGAQTPTGPARRQLTIDDLRVPGALGPETHEYRGMALHLYMKRTD